MISGIIQRIKSHLHVRKMSNKWRELNKHNSTYLQWIPRDDIFFEKVTVGIMTYGPINAVFSYHPDEKLSIGNYCSIGTGTIFMLGSEHPYKGISTFPFKVKCLGLPHEAQTKGPIILEDDVWVGENVLILSGVKLGKGTVVAAGSVVVKNTPPYSIVGGNPAKVIKYRFNQEIIELLLKTDLSKLTELKIRENIDLFYENVDTMNLHRIVEFLNI
jgi:virginiamycin A acetyltransferase